MLEPDLRWSCETHLGVSFLLSSTRRTADEIDNIDDIGTYYVDLWISKVSVMVLARYLTGVLDDWKKYVHPLVAKISDDS